MHSKSDVVNNILVSAVRSGMLEKVNELIDCYGLSYCQEWPEGFALLCDSLLYKKPEVAKLLLNKGSTINSDKVTEYNTKTTCVPIRSPLHISVSNNYIKISEMILDKGANMYDKDKNGNTPLYFAIHNMNIELIQLFLKRGYDINAKVTDGTSSIHEAAITRRVEVIEHIIANNGGDVNSVCSNTGFAPLHFAVQKSTKDIILFLLKRGAKVDLKGKNGMTPLHLASNRMLCSTDFVIILLNNGANVNAKTSANATPLHIAANRGYETTVQVLLQYGANVDDQDEDNKTVLQHAVLSKRLGSVKNILKYNPDINNENNRSLIVALLGHTGRGPYSIIYYNIVKSLLEYGFNICPKDANDIKLLHGAVEKGCLEVVGELLKYGADCHAREECYERTALHFTVLNQMYIANNEDDLKELQNRDYNLAKIAKLLISKGVNVNSKTKAGETTLHFACQYGYTEVVKVLLQHNANINSRDNKDTTPLYMSIEGCNENVSIILLDNGADANAKTIYGETPLHIAACRNNFHWSYKSSEITKTLSPKRFRGMIEAVLQFGAETETKNADGKTALHIATEAGYSIKNIQILLEYGSDINTTSNNNLTPFESAIEKCSHTKGIDPKFYIKTCKVLIAHIVKMKAANVYVSKNNLEKLSSSTRIWDYQNKCEEEIAKMKIDKINNTNVSIFDILTRSTSSLAMCKMNNENIVLGLESGSYKTEFPIYASTIECNFRKAMERKELLQQSDSILHFLLSNLPLPYECTEKIISYLSNRDLKILLRGLNYSPKIIKSG